MFILYSFDTITNFYPKSKWIALEPIIIFFSKQTAVLSLESVTWYIKTDAFMSIGLMYK